MHMTDLHRDPFVFKLMTLFKSDGYTAYGVTLELLGSNDAIDHSLTIEKELVAQSMRLPWERISEIYAVWVKEKPEFVCIDKGLEIEIYTPKIREIMDEWARRKANRKTPDTLGSGSGVTRELLGDKVKVKEKVKGKVKVKDKLPLSADADPCINEIVSCWNKIGEKQASSLDIVKCTKLTDSRERKLKTRLKDPYFEANWKEALRRAFKSSFIRGITPRGPGFENWRADFEWFLKPDTVTKLMEGKHDDKIKNEVHEREAD
jgi:hypothetical protein